MCTCELPIPSRRASSAWAWVVGWAAGSEVVPEPVERPACWQTEHQQTQPVNMGQSVGVIVLFFQPHSQWYIFYIPSSVRTFPIVELVKIELFSWKGNDCQIVLMSCFIEFIYINKISLKHFLFIIKSQIRPSFSWKCSIGNALSPHSHNNFRKYDRWYWIFSKVTWHTYSYCILKVTAWRFKGHILFQWLRLILQHGVNTYKNIRKWK